LNSFAGPRLFSHEAFLQFVPMTACVTMSMSPCSFHHRMVRPPMAPQPSAALPPGLVAVPMWDDDLSPQLPVSVFGDEETSPDCAYPARLDANDIKDGKSEVPEESHSSHSAILRQLPWQQKGIAIAAVDDCQVASNESTATSESSDVHPQSGKADNKAIMACDVDSEPSQGSIAARSLARTLERNAISPQRFLETPVVIKPIFANIQELADVEAQSGSLKSPQQRRHTHEPMFSGDHQRRMEVMRGELSAAPIPSAKTPHLLADTGLIWNRFVTTESCASSALAEPRTCRLHAEDRLPNAEDAGAAARSAATTASLAAAAMFEVTTMIPSLSRSHDEKTPEPPSPLCRRLKLQPQPQKAAHGRPLLPIRCLGFANATALSEASSSMRGSSMIEAPSSRMTMVPKTDAPPSSFPPAPLISHSTDQKGIVYESLFIDGDVRDEAQKGHCGFSVALAPAQVLARENAGSVANDEHVAAACHIVGGDLGMCHHFTWDGKHCVTSGFRAEHANRCAGRLCKSHSVSETQICRAGVDVVGVAACGSKPNTDEVEAVCGPPTTPPGICRTDTCPFVAEGSKCPYGGNKRFSGAVFRL